jgi:hypothetical protein
MHHTILNQKEAKKMKPLHHPSNSAANLPLLSPTTRVSCQLLPSKKEKQKDDGPSLKLTS